MPERHTLTPAALVALCGAYILSGLALVSIQTAAFFNNTAGGIGLTDSLWFIVPIGATPAIAVAIRRQPAWRATSAAHVVMLTGALSVVVDGNRFFTQISLAVVTIGQQVVGAALLVVAWRAKPRGTAVLAAAFILPRVLNEAVFLELFESRRLFERTPLIMLGSCLLLVGLLVSKAVQAGESGRPASDESSLDRSTIFATTIALAAGATISVQPDPFSGGTATGLALLAILIGFVVLGVTKQNRKTAEPEVHVDAGLLVFAAVVAALITWIEFGSLFFARGPTLAGTNIALTFDNWFQWQRALLLLLVLSTVPIVTFFGRRHRRQLSVGALFIAAAGLVWTFAVLADRELSLTESVLFTLLIEWGELIVLGGAVAFALRRPDGASIEAGLIIFLAALPLLETLARQIPFELIGYDLLNSGFEHTDDLRLFTVASSVGLIWMAAWWAFRDHRSGLGSSGPDDRADIEQDAPSVIHSEPQL